MILTADTETMKVTDETGKSYTHRECMLLLAEGKVDDMTAKTQRLLSMGGDWDALEKFYAECDQ